MTTYRSSPSLWITTSVSYTHLDVYKRQINVSAESVVTSDLSAFIEREIVETRCDPANLVFEITETALMRDIEKGRAFAEGVGRLGCSVALDDFGTGFGTFTHLKKLKVMYLKIDIEFVRGLVNSPENQHVVKAIVNLAHGFGCLTVAEGVEDGDVLAMLKDFDVDYAQGFHLGRPAPLGPVSYTHLSWNGNRNGKCVAT